ncbi:hypothetical protein M501DRAFT_463294 [Patellaria atrata CBS 101060]|uniref:Uncharacterized protein n=1 Tax=Patellaria atrata CBS 101060 TaxID=1346257 RepID=A0A9P4S545_9PEZI|nr:hypothetical protein M501DRAFT_463294 [Patellaria atrata CBS 101060]
MATSLPNDLPFKFSASFLLDGGSDVHVCNNPDIFKIERVEPGLTLGMGFGSVLVEAIGSFEVPVDTPYGRDYITMNDAYLCPQFRTSLISQSRAQKRGVFHHARKGIFEDLDGNEISRRYGNSLRSAEAANISPC